LIEQAVVLVRTDAVGNKELTAYVVSNQEITGSELRSYLGSYLPSYMLPVYYVRLDHIPLMANGKADKRALPDPASSDTGSGADYIGPRTATESTLVQLWSALLGLPPERIGIRDNFFELGGHSLKAVRLLSRIQKEFDVRLSLGDLFAHPFIADLSHAVDCSQASIFEPIVAVSKAEGYALSSAQRRLWVLSQFGEGNIAYNQVAAYRLRGDLHITSLEESFNAVIKRHEILRTVFSEDELGEVRQFVRDIDTCNFKISHTDLREEAAVDEGLLNSLMIAESLKAFDLSEGPLLRAGLYQLSSDEWLFTYTMHHIISDGWSMGILIREVLTYYKHHLSGIDLQVLPPLRIQYKDYAGWQLEQLKSDKLQADKAYWLNQFSDELPVLELATDKVRPSVKTYRGGTVRRTLGKDLTVGLNKLCQEQGATLFMGLLSGVNMLLYRYTGQTDIIVGSPTAGRDHGDLEDQIGFYVNTLALRSRFSGSDSYVTLLGRVRELTLGAYDHQSYPFDELVENLGLRRDMSRSPLFDVMIVLQNNEQVQIGDADLSGLEVASYNEDEQQGSKFDLTFTFIERGQEIALNVEYNSDVYSAATAEQLSSHLEQLLSVVLLSPDAEIAVIDYLSTTEREELLHGFNDTAIIYPQDKTVIDLFEEQVLLWPDKTALVYESVSLSYLELNKQANRMGAYLQSRYDLKTDDRIGVLLERSEWMVIAMIGIMKLNCVYVPIDKTIPEVRIKYMILASNLSLLITDDLFIPSAAESHEVPALIQLDEIKHYQGKAVNPGLNIALDDLSFLIFTSGSTGNPKAVQQTHRTLYNLVLWDINRAKLNQQSKHLQFSSFSFDSSLHDVYYALSTGGEIHVVSELLREDIYKLKDYILEKKISTLSMPYAALKVMFSEISSEHFKGHHICEIISTGEQLYINGGLRNFLKNNPSVTIFNFYGPSETHVVTGVSYSYKQSEIPEKASIGKPIDNTYILILDGQMQLVPVGVEGEIYIGGWNLARGYDGKAELTAEKFINDPFDRGKKVYRTGDIGKWDSNGEIEYLMRIDNQVKIRGYRIELGEIESALRGYDAIEEAIVIARLDKNGDNELIAYLVSNATINKIELHNYVGSRLPAYMLPSYYIQLDQIPLTANGKADKRAFPVATVDDLHRMNSYISPRNDIEIKLVEIWSEVLGHEYAVIGVTDNFFNLGGHSLKATSVIGRIHKMFFVRVSLVDFFMYPTVEGLGQIIQANGWVEHSAKNKNSRKNYYEI